MYVCMYVYSTLWLKVLKCMYYVLCMYVCRAEYGEESESARGDSFIAVGAYRIFSGGPAGERYRAARLARLKLYVRIRIHKCMYVCMYLCM